MGIGIGQPEVVLDRRLVIGLGLTDVVKPAAVVVVVEDNGDDDDIDERNREVGNWWEGIPEIPPPITLRVAGGCILDGTEELPDFFREARVDMAWSNNLFTTFLGVLDFFVKDSEGVGLKVRIVDVDVDIVETEFGKWKWRCR